MQTFKEGGSVVYCASTVGAHRVRGVSCSFFKFLLLRKQLHDFEEAAAGRPLTVTFQLERDCCLSTPGRCPKH